ncbi:MAG: DUF4160 domain-containing protein [Pseudanabaena sp. ELA607]
MRGKLGDRIENQGVIISVRYNGQKALIRTSPASLLAGQIPSKVKKLVVEWANLHQAELLENWELATKNKPLKTIEPLE